MEDSPHYIVQAQNIGVSLGAQGDGMAVHIPFHIGDAGPVQNCGDIFYYIITDLSFGEIQQQLIPAENIRMVVGQRPVRMQTVQIRIHIHRFRFEPQTEFHAHGPDSVCQTFQPVGELLPVHGVVAQTCLVIVAVAEPAVIQDEQLAAQVTGGFGQSQQRVLIEFEHAAFPVIVKYRPGAILPGGGDDVAIYKPMHPVGKLTETVLGETHDGFRGFESFAGA